MADEMKNHIPFAPFAYNNEYFVYTDKKDAEKTKFVSFMTQHNAEYKDTADTIYNNKKLDDKELMWESFRNNIEPPTPNIKEISSYEPINK